MPEIGATITIPSQLSSIANYRDTGSEYEKLVHRLVEGGKVLPGPTMFGGPAVTQKYLLGLRHCRSGNHLHHFRNRSNPIWHWYYLTFSQVS